MTKAKIHTSPPVQFSSVNTLVLIASLLALCSVITYYLCSSYKSILEIIIHVLKRALTLLTIIVHAFS